MVFKNFKPDTMIVALILVISLITGCSSQPIIQPSPSSSPQSPSSAPAAATIQDPIQTNILEIEEWKAKMTGEINKDYYVIDLRTPGEIEYATAIKGSINIDANETLAKGNVAIIAEKLADVPKDALILLHCRSGGRVKASLAKFTEAGYTNVFGLDGWTVFDAKGYMSAAKINPNTEHLKPEAWEPKINGKIGKDYYVIDSRTKELYDAGHIEGAMNLDSSVTFTVDHAVTMAQVEQAIPEKDAIILVHCGAGTKARIVQTHLKAEGYTNVFVLDNPITIDKDGNYRFE